MSSMCRSWACGCEFRATARVDRRRVHRGRRGRPAEGLHHASPTSTSASTEHHTVLEGVDAGQAARQGARPRAPATRSRSRPTRRTPSSPAATSAGRVRIRLTPERPQRRVLRAPRRSSTTTASASRSRARRRDVRARPRRVRPRRPPEPEDPAAARPRCSTTEYTFVDEWDVAARRPRTSSTRSPTARTYPQWWKPVYIDVTHRRRVHPPALQGPPALPPAHAHADDRTPSARTRSQGETDGDLRGTGIWTLSANADGGTHVRFDWRVHADRRLLQAPHARSCAPPCAGTTTGRSPARSKGSSPTCASVRRWPSEREGDTRDEGARAGEGRRSRRTPTRTTRSTSPTGSRPPRRSAWTRRRCSRRSSPTSTASSPSRSSRSSTSSTSRRSRAAVERQEGADGRRQARRAHDRLRRGRHQPARPAQARCRPCSTRARSQHAAIHVSGGRRGLEIELAPADLQRLTNATVAPISG